MKVYALATKTNECYGHGDYGEEWKIEQVDNYHKEGKWNPVFLSKADAQKFADGIVWFGGKVVELNVV